MKFARRPETFEARQFSGDSAAIHNVYLWVEQNTQGSFDYLGDIRPYNGVSIDPKDGAMIIINQGNEMRVKPGDWIIKFPNGGFIPCASDIFEQTYYEVEETEL